MSKYCKRGAVSVMDAVHPDQKPQIIPRCETTLKSFEDCKAWVSDLPDLQYICITPGKHLKYVADIECAFDIETTQINTAAFHHAYMYIGQFMLGDKIAYIRNWDTFVQLLYCIGKRYPELGKKEKPKKCSETRQIIMGIANSSFEFSFLQNLCNYEGDYLISSVFADNMRTPITVELDIGSCVGVKIIDVLRIGAESLKALGKYTTTQKKVGDLDYNKHRNQYTPLSPKEYRYCRNDVIVVCEYLRYFLDVFVKQCKLLPVTKTGIVRAAVGHEYFKQKRNFDKLSELFPDTYGDYNYIMSFLYRGGYTHANRAYVGKVVENVRGMDFTSSYPAVMCQCLYPMTKFQKIETPAIDDLDSYAVKKGVCWYAKFEFTRLISTTTHSIESVVKCCEFSETGSRIDTIRKCGIVEDNGRIMSALKISVLLTNVDYEIYRKFYMWDSCKVSDFHVAAAGKLPDYLIDVLKYFYTKKSVLKKQGLDGTAEYVYCKQMVNSLYGLSVQKLHMDEIKFAPDQGWSVSGISLDDPEAYEKLNHEYLKKIKRSPFNVDKYGKPAEPDFLLSPFWGIWVTAHARKRITDAIFYLKSDCIYCDTDSVYYINHDKHKVYFDCWNGGIEKINRYIFGLSYDDLGDLGEFDPVCIKWCEYDIVKSTDADGDEITKKILRNSGKSKVFKFKTWGAKRYIKTDGCGHMEQTIAGLPKESLFEKVKGENPTLPDTEIVDICFDMMEPDLELSLAESMKMTTCYNDKFHTDCVTDEFGNSEMMQSASSVCLYDIPFKMTVSGYFIGMLEYLYETKRDTYFIDDIPGD